MFSNGVIRDYKLDKELVWQIGSKTSGWYLRVPVGTEFESSVPFVLRWILSPADPAFLKAACVHDYLLENGYTRAFADSQWLEVNLSEHTPKLKTKLAYLGMVLKRVSSYVKQ